MSLPAGTHICFVCPYIEPYLRPGSDSHVGGAERQQYLLAQQFRDAGHSVSFITFERDGPEHEEIDGFDCWRTLPQTNEIRRTPAVLSALVRSIRRVDADLYYVRGNPPLCILTSYTCRVLGVPLVYAVANDSNVELARLADHHGMFEYTLPKLGYVDAMGRATRVVAQTAHQEGILRDVFGIDARVIPNGYTVVSPDDVAPPEEREYVLWVGSLDPEQKQPELLVDAAAELPEVDFRMIGSTDDAQYERHLRERADGLANLQFEGFVPPDEIDAHYRSAVALVNTSAYEGFPNTFLEAWRYAVPVVSLNEVLDGQLERDGLGCHAGSTEGLLGQLESWWNDPERAVEVGETGRSYLADNYSLPAVADAYGETFAEALASGSAQP